MQGTLCKYVSLAMDPAEEQEARQYFYETCGIPDVVLCDNRHLLLHSSALRSTAFHFSYHIGTANNVAKHDMLSVEPMKNWDPFVFGPEFAIESTPNPPKPCSPVQSARKFSAVLGTTSARSTMMMRPTSLFPIRMSKNTCGLRFFSSAAFGSFGCTSSVPVSIGCSAPFSPSFLSVAPACFCNQLSSAQTGRLLPSLMRCGFAVLTRIVRPHSSESFMLSTAAAASSAFSNSMKANPRCFCDS
uniref:Uncharacterized protein n=1 Tax=Anopheles coluzzii TaxID=1518534 RepID=A0A8W7P7F4_ANOCL